MNASLPLQYSFIDDRSTDSAKIAFVTHAKQVDNRPRVFHVYIAHDTYVCCRQQIRNFQVGWSLKTTDLCRQSVIGVPPSRYALSKGRFHRTAGAFREKQTLKNERVVRSTARVVTKKRNTNRSMLRNVVLPSIPAVPFRRITETIVFGFRISSINRLR